MEITVNHRTCDVVLRSRANKVIKSPVLASEVAALHFERHSTYQGRACFYLPAYDRFCVQGGSDFDITTDGLLLYSDSKIVGRAKHVRKTEQGSLRGALVDDEGKVAPVTFEAFGNFMIVSQRFAAKKGSRLLRRGIDRDSTVLWLCRGLDSIRHFDFLSRWLSALCGARCLVAAVGDSAGASLTFAVTSFEHPGSAGATPIAYGVANVGGSLSELMVVVAYQLLLSEPDFPFLVSRRARRRYEAYAANVPMAIMRLGARDHKRTIALAFEGVLRTPPDFDVGASWNLVLDEGFTLDDFHQALNRSGGFSRKALCRYADVPKGVFGVHVARYGAEERRPPKVSETQFYKIATSDVHKNLLVFFVCGKGKLFWSKLLTREEVPGFVARMSAEASRFTQWVSPNELNSRALDFKPGKKKHKSRKRIGNAQFQRQLPRSPSPSDEEVAVDERYFDHERQARSKSRRERGGGKRNNQRQRTAQQQEWEEDPHERRSARRQNDR